MTAYLSLDFVGRLVIPYADHYYRSSVPTCDGGATFLIAVQFMFWHSKLNFPLCTDNSRRFPPQYHPFRSFRQPSGLNFEHPRIRHLLRNRRWCSRRLLSCCGATRSWRLNWAKRGLWTLSYLDQDMRILTVRELEREIGNLYVLTRAWGYRFLSNWWTLQMCRKWPSSFWRLFGHTLLCTNRPRRVLWRHGPQH